MAAPALLTETEAAEMLRLCPRKLRQARQHGRLRYVLFGRAVRYTIDDLLAFVDSARRLDEPGQPPAMARPKAVGKRGGNIVPFSQRGP